MLAISVAIFTPSASADAQTTVLVLGDSISAAYGIQREQGWVHLLGERLAGIDPVYQVVNASISGETTGGGLARLPAVLATHDPAVVIIELGGNDGLRGYPVARIRSNLEQLVATADPDRREIILVGMQIPPNYGPRYTRSFQGLFEDISAEYDVALVPSFLESVALKPELMQRDGIHPKAEAQFMLLDTLWPHVWPLLHQ